MNHLLKQEQWYSFINHQHSSRGLERHSHSQRLIPYSVASIRGREPKLAVHSGWDRRQNLALPCQSQQHHGHLWTLVCGRGQRALSSVCVIQLTQKRICLAGFTCLRGVTCYSPWLLAVVWYTRAGWWFETGRLSNWSKKKGKKCH